MKTNEEIKKELEELAPKFSQLEKENPFAVPPNYFTNMQAEVFEKLNPKATPATPTFWNQLLAQWQNWFLPKPAFALAGIAVLVGLVFFWNQAPAGQDAFASIDATVLEEYVAENLDEFETDLFLELAAEEEVSFSFEENEEEALIDEILEELDDAELLNLL